MPPQEIKDLAIGRTQNEKKGVTETEVLREK
jgi:hypothetical protein